MIWGIVLLLLLISAEYGMHTMMSVIIMVLPSIIPLYAVLVPLLLVFIWDPAHENAGIRVFQSIVYGRPEWTTAAETRQQIPRIVCYFVGMVIYWIIAIHFL